MAVCRISIIHYKSAGAKIVQPNINNLVARIPNVWYNIIVRMIRSNGEWAK